MPQTCETGINHARIAERRGREPDAERKGMGLNFLGITRPNKTLPKGRLSSRPFLLGHFRRKPGHFLSWIWKFRLARGILASSMKTLRKQPTTGGARERFLFPTALRRAIRAIRADGAGTAAPRGAFRQRRRECGQASTASRRERVGPQLHRRHTLFRAVRRGRLHSRARVRVQAEGAAGGRSGGRYQRLRSPRRGGGHRLRGRRKVEG